MTFHLAQLCSKMGILVLEDELDEAFFQGLAFG